MHTRDIRLLTMFLFTSAVFAQSAPERVFHFKAADTAQDVQEIATVIRNIGGLRELSIDDTQKTLTIHGTAGELAFADWLFNDLDDSEASSQSSNNEYRMSVASDDVVHVFHLTNAATVQQVQEIATSVRSIAEIRRLFTYNASKTIVARGSAGQIALAGWLVSQADKPPVGQGIAQSQNSAASEYKYAADGDDVVKVLYLTNTQTVEAFQELAVLIRSITQIRRAFTYNAPRVLMVRGTAEQTALATWLSNELDKTGQHDPGSPVHEYKMSASTDDVVRVFYLPPTDTIAAFQGIVTDVRKTTNIRTAYTYNGPRAWAVRGTTNEIAWADQLIRAQKK